jgi:hypothetical protein
VGTGVSLGGPAALAEGDSPIVSPAGASWGQVWIGRSGAPNAVELDKTTAPITQKKILALVIAFSKFVRFDPWGVYSPSRASSIETETTQL